MSAEKQPSPPPADAQFHQLTDQVSDHAIFMLDLTGRVLSWKRALAAKRSLAVVMRLEEEE